MNKLEQLEQKAFEKKVHVRKYYLGGPNLKGIYMDGNIALNTSLKTSAEKTCTMAEELGHHETTVGNILDMSICSNRKQERQARLYGYNLLIGLRGLIDAYEHGSQTCSDAADYLEVTEEYLQECIDSYRDKYGIGIAVDNYYIMFIPHLAVGKMV